MFLAGEDAGFWWTGLQLQWKEFSGLGFGGGCELMPEYSKVAYVPDGEEDYPPVAM